MWLPFTSSFSNKTCGRIIAPFRIKRPWTNSTFAQIKGTNGLSTLELINLFEQKLIDLFCSFEGRACT
ncbi:hypothetical protein EUGRSUZ_H02225 [Eucalyptus grandis]|uniref:Uncharacterized protein n=2 Tax=Eucalyptus grandis TaxID=71139 RepID=A0ACC3JRC3_EUCGR|nr:hypothetical protein EUGRSUZ_H02225 [Eucalyptus grandis]